MSEVVIKVDNLSKQYRLGEIGTGSLSHDINRWWFKVRGKENPYLKISEVNDRTSLGKSDYVWSLRDINFEINQGDAVGFIGRNGAGKSTLLKVLSRVTAPTTGTVKIKGRVASLLEVGTGFHPDLSGRDNIFLNGAILGMRREEIKRKFDEIVDFAGVERYIDTPVKRYSSGMYVRLAFGVAAHLESEILIVDEVLAVGDAEFQKKCLGKMGEVSKGEGRTVLFVSHNMAAISNLCKKSVLLKHGMLQDFDNTQVIIDKYIRSGKQNEAEVSGVDINVTKFCDRAAFLALRLVSAVNGVTSNFAINEEISIEIEYQLLDNEALITPSIHLLDSLGTCIFSSFNGHSANLVVDEYYGKPQKKGKYKTICKIPANFLNDKNYTISAFLVPDSVDNMAIAENVLSFTVEETGEMRREYTGDWWGIIRPKLYWSTNPI